MQYPVQNLPLRRILVLDGVTCGAMAVALLVAPDSIAELTALPAGLLRGAGALLVPVALFIGWVARSPVPSRGAVAVIVAGNIGWAVASLLALLMVAPNTLGATLVVGQALAVLAFAAAEARAYRGRHLTGAA